MVTGAFGNVGESAVTELLKDGHWVRCFDLPTRANARKARKLEQFARQTPGRLEVLWGDLRQPADVARAVQDQEVVVHLAFIIPKMSATGVESEAQPELAEAVNVGGTRNLLTALEAQPTPPRLIFASSLHVYGLTQHLPPPRTVADPPRPTEHYSRHKVACEEMIRVSGLQWAILRLAATLPLAIRLDPGMFDVPLDNRIEFVHTRDVGLAIARAVRSDAVWGKTLLIGGGPRCQFRYGEMVERILDAMGVGMLPAAAFSTTPFATDWLDTAESQRLLQYQTRDLNDYVHDMVELLGPRRHLIRAFAPIVRAAVLARSPYYRRRQEAEVGRAGQPAPVALVTGASSGIGAATARRLAAEGYRVVLVARRTDRLESLAREIQDAGGQAVVLAADLSDEEERRRVYEQAKMSCGAVDVVINNAGFGWYGYATDMPWGLARQMMATNVAAVVHLTLMALADMKARGRGHVINVSSVVGSLPNQGVAIYSATKAFVDAFSTALFRELRGTGVHVSVVRPGVVATEFYDVITRASGLRVPVERLGVQPEAVAGRIVELLRRPRRLVYVPGWLRFVPWVEPMWGWLIDLLGPLLLRRQMRPV